MEPFNPKCRRCQGQLLGAAGLTLLTLLAIANLLISNGKQMGHITKILESLRSYEVDYDGTGFRTLA